MAVTYVGERPKEWGPIGTLIVVGHQRPVREHETEESADNQPKAESSASATPSTPEAAAANANEATDVDKAK